MTKSEGKNNDSVGFAGERRKNAIELFAIENGALIIPGLLADHAFVMFVQRVFFKVAPLVLSSLAWDSVLSSPRSRVFSLCV